MARSLVFYLVVVVGCGGGNGRSTADDAAVNTHDAGITLVADASDAERSTLDASDAGVDGAFTSDASDAAIDATLDAASDADEAHASPLRPQGSSGIGHSASANHRAQIAVGGFTMIKSASENYRARLGVRR